MNMSEIREMLESIPGFSEKVAYRAFPENEAPELPYLTYEENNTSNIFADNKAYVQKSSYTISLVEAFRDRAVEQLIENKLNEHEIAWNRYPEWIEEEKIYQIDYETEV